MLSASRSSAPSERCSGRDVGIALITALIATMVMTIARKVVVPDGIPSPSLKIAGAALGCVGAALLAVTLMPG